MSPLCWLINNFCLVLARLSNGRRHFQSHWPYACLSVFSGISPSLHPNNCSQISSKRSTEGDIWKVSKGSPTSFLKLRSRMEERPSNGYAMQGTASRASLLYIAFGSGWVTPPAALRGVEDKVDAKRVVGSWVYFKEMSWGEGYGAMHTNP